MLLKDVMTCFPSSGIDAGRGEHTQRHKCEKVRQQRRGRTRQVEAIGALLDQEQQRACTRLGRKLVGGGAELGDRILQSASPARERKRYAVGLQRASGLTAV